MKLSQLILLAVLATGFVSGNHPSAQAQEPANWKILQQTFTKPKFPGLQYVYKHRVTMEKGRFIADFVHQYEPQQLTTVRVSMNLADIEPSKMQVMKDKEGYAPSIWYLFIPVKNPNKAPERQKVTAQTAPDHLILKDQIETINGVQSREYWLLTTMYLRFDNEAAARQAVADITTACQ